MTGASLHSFPHSRCVHCWMTACRCSAPAGIKSELLGPSSLVAILVGAAQLAASHTLCLVVPEQAAKLGLVDGVVAKERLLAAAREWAAAIAAGTKPRNFSLYR